MTPRSLLLAPAPVGADDPAAERVRLGLRALATTIAAAEARGIVRVARGAPPVLRVVLPPPGIDAPRRTALDARNALPRILRDVADGLESLRDEADDAARSLAHGDRHIASLHRTARASCQAMLDELHAAVRVAGVGIAAREGGE